MIGISPWPSGTPPFVAEKLMNWTASWSQWFSNLVTQVNASAALTQTGTGTPEGAVKAARGALWLRQDGAASTTLYVKTTGGVTAATLTNTGWVAVTLP